MAHNIKNVLDDGIGEVELLTWMGGDLANVNGARASYATRKETLDESDNRLLQRLGGDIHHTPLRHTYFQLYVTAPEFVARQWYKHIVGCEYGFKDLPWSEFSMRYKEVPPEFYIPRAIRIQSQHNKQASEQSHSSALHGAARTSFETLCNRAYNEYEFLLSIGVAREQARIVLPLATYTSWVWTASVQALVHFCVLRNETGAQFEIQQYAKVVEELCRDKAPATWTALEQNHSVTLKKTSV